MKNRALKTLPILALMLIGCGSFLQTAYAQDGEIFKKGVIYIVRHAEKDTGNDPRLSSQGIIRAGELRKLMKGSNYKLDRLYVTKYKRTQLTADSVRLSQKVDTVIYVPDTSGDGFMNALMRHKKDKRILVVGHSNTIPGILRKLGITDFPNDIPDNEYDNFFTVTFHKGKAFLFRKKYGRPSAAGNAVSTIKMLQ